MLQEAADNVGSSPVGSSPARWAYFDGRQNRLRDVARRPVSLDTLSHTQIRASLGRANHDPRNPAGNLNSLQAAVFSTSIIDVIVGS